MSTQRREYGGRQRAQCRRQRLERAVGMGGVNVAKACARSNASAQACIRYGCSVDGCAQSSSILLLVVLALCALVHDERCSSCAAQQCGSLRAAGTVMQLARLRVGLACLLPDAFSSEQPTAVEGCYRRQWWDIAAQGDILFGYAGTIAHVMW